MGPSAGHLAAAGPAAGRRGRGGRTPTVVWVSVLLMVGLLGAFIVADWAARVWEMKSLLTAVEGSEAEMVAANAGIVSIVGDADPEAAEPGLASVGQELQVHARTSRDRVAAAALPVAEAAILPWHSDIAEARDAYLGHNAAWVDHLDRGSRSFGALFDTDEAIASTWRDFGQAVRRAVPRPDPAGIETRLSQIVGDDGPEIGEPEDGSTLLARSVGRG